MIRAALFTLLLLAAGATAGAADTEAPPWYDVEVLVFKNNTPPAPEGERWPIDPGAPDFGSAVELVPLPQSNPLPGPAQPFQQLGAANFSLKPAAARLSASRDYHKLLHIAWRQPASAQADAPAVRLHSEGEDTGTEGMEPMVISQARELDGTVRISRNRFLHIDVDMIYRDTAARDGAAQFRLQQSRRVNSGEVHYFDHPAFGLLVKLTPYDPQKQKDASTTPR
ncbi:MAG: peptidoglycan binding protein CsiV [Gammaproteobacteria bacterium]|nr:peptidoglycan binding protein CsiV [Gammaproteobacteria bacterium]